MGIDLEGRTLQAESPDGYVKVYDYSNPGYSVPPSGAAGSPAVNEFRSENGVGGPLASTPAAPAAHASSTGASGPAKNGGGGGAATKKSDDDAKCHTCHKSKKKKETDAATPAPASAGSGLNPGWMGMAGGLAIAAGAIAMLPALAGVGLAAGAAGTILSMLGGASLLSSAAALGGKLFEQPGDAVLDGTIHKLETVGLYTGVASALGGLLPALFGGSERATAAAVQAAMRSFEYREAQAAAVSSVPRVEGQVIGTTLGEGAQYTEFLLADGTPAVAYTGSPAELRGALQAVEKVGETQPGLLPKVYGQTTLPGGETALVLEDYSGMTKLITTHNNPAFQAPFKEVFTPKAYEQLFHSPWGYGRGLDKDYLFVDANGAPRVGIPRRAAEFNDRVVGDGAFR